MQLSADSHPHNDCDETAVQLASAMATLESALAILDSLGMNTAAGHVSYGLEIVRDRLQSLQNGGTSPSSGEPHPN